jgi:hypothetical protein
MRNWQTQMTPSSMQANNKNCMLKPNKQIQRQVKEIWTCVVYTASF